jgi:hypothetical protein
MYIHVSYYKDNYRFLAVLMTALKSTQMLDTVYIYKQYP